MTDTRQMPPVPLAALQQIVDQAYNSVLITDAGNNAQHDHRIIYVNPALCQMTGYAADELLGRNPRMLQGPLTSLEVIDQLRHCLQAGKPFQGSTYNYRKDGSSYLLQWNVSPVHDEQGRITHFVSVQNDISALATAQASAGLFAQALDTTQDGVLICDHEGTIEFVNQGYTRITGLRREEVIGHKPSVARSGKHDPAFYHALWGRLQQGLPFRETFVNRHTSGAEIHCEESITPLRNQTGDITHYVSIIHDITERVLSEQALLAHLQSDGLTGALTRASGTADLEAAVTQAQAQGAPLSLALLDVDHFKQVNDRFGHPTGDQVLATVARTVSACLRASDKIIRWGGEEFMLVMPSCKEADALKTLERCRPAIRQACKDLLPIPITISAGVGQIAAHQSLHDCIERIDQALYRAKRAGRDQIQCAIPAPDHGIHG